MDAPQRGPANSHCTRCLGSTTEVRGQSYRGGGVCAKSNLRWYISLWDISRSPIVSPGARVQRVLLVCEKFAENPEFRVGNSAVNFPREIKVPRNPPPPFTEGLRSANTKSGSERGGWGHNENANQTMRALHLCPRRAEVRRVQESEDEQKQGAVKEETVWERGALCGFEWGRTMDMHHQRTTSWESTSRGLIALHSALLHRWPNNEMATGVMPWTEITPPAGATHCLTVCVGGGGGILAYWLRTAKAADWQRTAGRKSLVPVAAP